MFSETLRDLLPRVKSHERAEFFAAFYIVGHLAYGLSSIAAGFLSDAVGLRSAATIHAAAAIVLTVSVALAKAPQEPHNLETTAPHHEGARK